MRLRGAAITQLRRISSIVHKEAADGFSFESAALYSKSRPNYPRESLERIRELMPTSKQLKVLEVGAGTGIPTLIHPYTPLYTTWGDVPEVAAELCLQEPESCPLLRHLSDRYGSLLHTLVLTRFLLCA